MKLTKTSGLALAQAILHEDRAGLRQLALGLLEGLSGPVSTPAEAVGELDRALAAAAQRHARPGDRVAFLPASELPGIWQKVFGETLTTDSAGKRLGLLVQAKQVRGVRGGVKRMVHGRDMRGWMIDLAVGAASSPHSPRRKSTP